MSVCQPHPQAALHYHNCISLAVKLIIIIIIIIISVTVALSVEGQIGRGGCWMVASIRCQGVEFCQLYTG